MGVYKDKIFGPNKQTLHKVYTLMCTSENLNLPPPFSRLHYNMHTPLPQQNFDSLRPLVEMRLIDRAITIIPCVLIIAFCDVNKIMGLLNLVQFVQLPFAIIPLLKMYYSPKIMEGYTISKCRFGFVIIMSVVIQIFNIFAVYEVVKRSTKVIQVLTWVLIGCHTIFIGKFWGFRDKYKS